MAHDLNLNHIAEKISVGDTLSIGVDSVKNGNVIVYNLSVVLRVNGNKAALIWTKDIEDTNLDDLYRDINELNLLTSLYKELYDTIKNNEIKLSVKIHKNWFNRFKYEQRNYKLKIENFNE
jgi:hypothetical protein